MTWLPREQSNYFSQNFSAVNTLVLDMDDTVNMTQIKKNPKKVQFKKQPAALNFNKSF